MIESYEYYGHDAVVRVRPEVDQLPELVVRVTGGSPMSTGSRVGLSVRGLRGGLAHRRDPPRVGR